MYNEFNAHPKGIKTGDCVVRAISTATSKDYLEVRKDLNRKKREWGFTSYKDTKFLYKYLEQYTRLIVKVGENKLRIKGHDFAKAFPKGIYILKLRGHVTVCIDGVIYDTWDCSYLSVYTAWKIK